MNGHYTKAQQLMMANAGTPGADGLAKMVKSLYCSAYRYAFSECVADLNPAMKALCLDMCNDYATNGLSAELEQVGQTVVDKYDHARRVRAQEIEDDKALDRRELERLEELDKRPHRSVFR